MKVSCLAVAVLSLFIVAHPAVADEFYTKGSGNAVDISKWKAVRAGTITVLTGSTAVVGTGTQFLSYYQDAPNRITTTNGLTVIGTVASIEDNEHLTLTAPVDADYADYSFTTESLPTINDNITVRAGDNITVLEGDLGVNAFGATNVTIEGTLGTDVHYFNVVNNLTINTGGVLQTASGVTRLIFDAAATIGGTADILIDYFRVKEAGVVTLLKDVTVTNILELQGGRINTGNFTLTVGTSALSPGTYEQTSFPSAQPGRINGTLRRWVGEAAIPMGDTAGLFPMSDGVSGREVWIAKPFGATGTISVRHDDASNVVAFASSYEENGITFTRRHNMNWTIAADAEYVSTSGSGLTDLRIHGAGVDYVMMPYDKLNISLANDPVPDGTYVGSAVLPDESGEIAGVPYTVIGDTVVTRTGLSAAQLSNTFYISSPDGASLPVELTAFAATAKGKAIELRWATATERNNFGFEIQRSTAVSGAAPRQWVKIGFVEGHGTTNAQHSYGFTDPVAAGMYAYRLKQIDRDGRYEYSGEIEASMLTAPADHLLGQNYPNPFNPSTSIHFTLAVAGRAVMKVYNTLGQEVRTLFDGTAEAHALQTVVFDAKDLPSGTYFYTLRTGTTTDVKKMQLLR